MDIGYKLAPNGQLDGEIMDKEKDRQPDPV